MIAKLETPANPDSVTEGGSRLESDIATHTVADTVSATAEPNSALVAPVFKSVAALSSKQSTHTVTDYRALLLAGTPLMDVRAPVEFARGAIPGAVNRPLLSDEERHQVGISYKLDGQNAAIKLAAGLIDDTERERRLTQWKTFADAHPKGALYCFRGGLRSRIVQQWLKDVGVKLPLVDGGYKAMRRWIIDTLEALVKHHRFVLIAGRTGSGKTLLIKQLGRSIDLEGLARHRGSSFGQMLELQPSNIDFENALTVALLRLDESVHLAADSTVVSAEYTVCGNNISGEVSGACVFLEDEARLIGKVCLPDVLREAMQRAPIAILETPMASRIDCCFDDYVTDLLSRYQTQLGGQAGFNAYAVNHRSNLLRVQRRFGAENTKLAMTLLDKALDQHQRAGDTSGYAAFIELMLTSYYDPMYDYQLSGKAQRIEFTGDAAAIVEWAGSR